MTDRAFDTDKDDLFAAIEARHGFSMGGGTAPAGEEDDPFAQIEARHGFKLGTGTSAVGSFFRGAERSLIPSLGSLPAIGAGAEAGAALGTPLAPFTFGLSVPGGALLGGAAGGLGAGYVLGKAQDWALSKLPDSWVEKIGMSERQQKLDEEHHGVASFLGGLAPYAVTMRPGGLKGAPLPENATGLQRIMANPLTARVFGGAVMGGLELGQEAAHGESPDWTKVAISTGFGIVFNQPTRIGERLTAIGQRPVLRLVGREEPAAPAPAPAPGELPAAPAPPQGGPEAAPAAAPSGPAVTGRQFRNEILERDYRGRPYPTIADAADLGVMGPGTTEDTFLGSHQRSESAEQSAREQKQLEASVIGEQPKADVHSLARQMHLELFNEYDRLQAQRAEFAKAVEEGAGTQAQHHLAATDEALNGMRGEIKAAYRRAAEAGGHEMVEPEGEAAGVRADTAVPGAEAVVSRPPARTIEEQRAFIKNDVVRQLQRAGRPKEEAEAAGALIAARYETRAALFKGARGTAEDLYRSEGAEILGPGMRAQQPVVSRPSVPRKVNESLIPFLRSSGGISPSDPLASDLRAILGNDSRIFKEGGMTLDRAREAAAEAGYIANEGRGGTENRGGGTSTVRDLLDAISQESRGRKVYRPGMEPRRGAVEGREPTPEELEEASGPLDREAESELMTDEDREALAGALELSQKVRPNLDVKDDGTQIHVQPKDMELPDWAKPYKWGITAYRGVRNGRPAIYIRDSRLPEEAQGKGYGVAMYEELAELAEQEGLPFESDATVTKQATLMWAALKRRGYDVQTAKNVKSVEGPPEAPHLGRYETSDGGPVFWIKSDREAAGLELFQPSAPEFSGPVAGLEFFEGTRGQAEQLRRARRGGATKDEITRMAAEFRQAQEIKAPQDISPEGRSILKAIEKLTPGGSGTGNYVRVDLLRQELPSLVDKDIIALADQGKLVLAPYGGPRPRSREEGLRYVKDDSGELFIGVALPRLLEQPARGKINLNPTGEPGRDFIGVADVKPIIRMMKDANASTIIHEYGGHAFLGELLRDAEHELAPDQLKADAQTTLKWLGVERADLEIDSSATKAQIRKATAAHEKFATGFEQYLREGTAPSAGLARVFAQFRQWLLNIYQTIKGLGQPINEDIRGVFDRMLAEEPQRTVVAPERATPPSHADVWEADARAAEPDHADATEARVAHEQQTRYAEIPDDIKREFDAADARLAAEPGGSSGESASGPGPVQPAGGNAEPVAPSGGGGANPGAGRAGAAQPSGQGNRISGKPRGEGESGSQRAHLGDVPLAPNPAADLAGRDTFNVGKNGNIRTENITSIKQFADAIEQAKDSIGGTDEPMTDGQVMDAAQSMGFDPSELTLDKLARSFGGIKDLNKKVLAFRMAVRDQAEIIGDLMRRIKETDDDALVKEYARERERFDMFMSVLSSVTTEWGRAGRSFRNLEGWDEVRNVALTEQIKSRTGRTLFQLKMEAKLGAQLDTPAKVAKFLRDAQKRSFGGMVMEYFINNLISGPATHATYMVGNKLTMLQDAVPETLLASAIGAARRAFGRQGERVYTGEAWQQVKAVGANLPKSLQGAIEAIRTGQPTLLPGQTARPLTPFYGDTALNLAKNIQNDPVTWHEVAGDFYGAMKGIRDGLVSGASLIAAGGHAGAPIVGAHWSPLGQIPDIAIRGVPAIPLGSLVRLPGRAVSAIHSMDTIANYSRYIAARAYREGIELGKDGAALNQHIAARTANPPEEWMEAGHKEAYAQTLMSEGGNFVKRLSALINTAATVPGLGQIRPLKFIDPFVHIGANVINQAVLKRTPLGIFSEEIRNDLLGKNGNVAQDYAQARMLAGTAMAIGFGSLAMEGYVTGSGPSNPHQAAAWREVYQPHSIRIGDMWYQVNRLGPMGMHLGIAADLYEVARDISEGDALTAAAHLQHAITQNILDESFMRGPSELIKALDDPGRYGESYLKNFAASFVPFSVGVFQMNRAADPYTRQARTVMDSIMQRLPGQSVYLQPKINVWGEEVPSPDAFGHAGLTAIYMKQINSDPVRQAMLDLGVAPAPVPKAIRNVDLTDQEYTDFARTAGRMAKMRLDAIVRSADWQRWPNHLRHDVIAEVVKQSREAARGWMMGRYPHIVRDAVEDIRERKTGEPEPIR